MTKRRNVKIIGGGVIGLSLGWELSQRGLDVTIIQKNTAKQTTSWTAGGILPPANLARAIDPLDRLRGFSHELYQDWVFQLESATQIDCGFRRCGGWYLANTPGERASMIGMTRYWDELGISCEAVSRSELAVREPRLQAWIESQPSASGWWVADEWQIRPPRLLQALRMACQSTGVQFVDNTSVRQIGTADSGPRYRIGDDWHDCDDLILCAGAWSGEVGESLGLRHSIIPVRGQVLLLKTEKPELKSIINVGHRYLIPRDDGHVFVGSCEEETGFETGTTPKMLETFSQFAETLVPSLRNAERVAAWSGIRPMTFDGFPMIGRVPEHPQLFVAAGHFRSGWHLAPATAKCMAALVLGDSPAVSLDAFNIGSKQTKSEQHASILTQ